MQALPYLESNDLPPILDPRLGNMEAEMPSVRRVAAAALLCLRTEPKQRPALSYVATFLEGEGVDDQVVRHMVKPAEPRVASVFLRFRSSKAPENAPGFEAPSCSSKSAVLEWLTQCKKRLPSTQ